MVYIILFALNLSCSNSNSLYEKSFSIPDTGWTMHHTLEDSWSPGKPASADAVLIHVFHSPEFNYQNLYLTGRIEKDSQSLWADTFSIQLSRPHSGRWLGQKQDDSWIVSDTIPLSVQMAQGENLYFQFSQFSRERNLSGIEKVVVEVVGR